MPRGPCSPETASLLPAGQRPRGCRSTRPGGGAWPHRSVDVTAARRPAGPPAASPRHYCARARGRAELGPVGRSSTTPLCPGPPPGRTRPSRPLHLAPTVPGLAADPNSAQSASPPRSHCARAHGRDGPGSGRTPPRPAGGPRPGDTSDGAATPADGRTQIGRCGVLTRIPVGAAAAAGPGRFYAAAALAGLDPTHRHSTPRRPVGRALALPRPQVPDVPTRLAADLAGPNR